MDYDYDHRKNAAKIKAEAEKLVSSLTSAISALEKGPFYLRDVLNIESSEKLGIDLETDDVYGTALAVNRALLETSLSYVNKSYVKEGAVRFTNACRGAVQLWKDISGEEFLWNIKTKNTTNLNNETIVDPTFVSDSAQFVFVVVHGIDRWAKVSRVQDSLDVLREENRPSPS